MLPHCNLDTDVSVFWAEATRIKSADLGGPQKAIKYTQRSGELGKQANRNREDRCFNTYQNPYGQLGQRRLCWSAKDREEQQEGEEMRGFLDILLLHRKEEKAGGC